VKEDAAGAAVSWVSPAGAVEADSRPGDAYSCCVLSVEVVSGAVVKVARPIGLQG
jgi:hypothetical protein